jgi:tRNA pseudouridine38-40 synthase
VSCALPRPWESTALLRALRALTPDDVWIERVGRAPDGFHARRDALARRYRYVVGCDPAAFSPFRRPYEWAIKAPVDRELLERSATAFAGEHDFRAFAAAGSAVRHHRCRIAYSAWQARPEARGFIFDVEADRFLHRMVRFMVGTMMDVARHRRPLADVARLLERPTNDETSPPAPPHGLYFLAARYARLDQGQTE